jgi:hypothetical protein
MQKTKIFMSLFVVLILCLGVNFAEANEPILDLRGTDLYKIDDTSGESLVEDEVMAYGQAGDQVYYLTTKGRFYERDLSKDKSNYLSAGKSDYKIKDPVDLVVTTNPDKRTFVTILQKDGSTRFYEIKSKKYYYLNDAKSLNEAGLWTDRMTFSRHFSKGYDVTLKGDSLYVTLTDLNQEMLLMTGVYKAEKEPANNGIRVYYIATNGDFMRYNVSSREAVKIKGTQNVQDFQLVKQGQYVKYVICLRNDNTYHAYKLKNGDNAVYLGDVDSYDYDSYALMKLPEYEEESTFEDDFSRMPVLEILEGKYEQVSSYGGSLQSSITDALQSVAYYKGKNMKDAKIVTNITVYNGSTPYANAGLMFRWDGLVQGDHPKNGYYVGVRPKSSDATPAVMIGKFVNGQWTKIKEVKSSVNVGNNQKLLVQAYDNHFVVYHDGKKVLDLYDNTFSEGKIGFRAWKMPATYKDFSVSSTYVNEFTSTQLDLDVVTGMYNKVHQFNGSLQNIVTDAISVAAIKDKEFKNGYITTDMTIYRGDNPHGNSGVFFRVQDYTDNGEIKNGYYVGLKAKSDGVKSAVLFGKFVDGQWQLIQQVNPSVTYGESHNQHLVVEVDGSYVNVGFDGDFMFQAKDETFTEAGDVGYRSWRGSALYKNIIIMDEE